MLGKILITKPVFPEAIDFLKERTTIDTNAEDRVLSRRELIARLQGKQGALTQLTDIFDREVLESIPDVRILCNIAVGYNNVDTEAASRLGILVTNTLALRVAPDSLRLQLREEDHRDRIVLLGRDGTTRKCFAAFDPVAGWSGESLASGTSSFGISIMLLVH